MHLKDHYKTLELQPSATLPEIKKAYRKLAQQYHPDKNNDDPYAIAYFNDIKEAYETLTNPAIKENYLQQRWYNRAMGRDKTADTINPVGILKQAIDFERYTATLDEFRLDSNTLFEFMDGLLSDKAITQLEAFKEPEINQQIVLRLAKSMALMKYEHAKLISNKMIVLAAGDSESLSLIETTLHKIQQKKYWQSRQWIFILLITIAILSLIWFSGRG